VIAERRLTWLIATAVDVVAETSRVRTLVLDVPDWPGHRAGQHVDIRLTAEDGYQAQRSYSIASAPADDQVALTVERIEDGEVSPYLVDVLEAGDSFELRGPIGGYFVWEPGLGGPLLLLAGGSGIVPLMAMLRHRAAAGSDVPARLVYSARTADDLIYRDELERLAAAGDGFELVPTLTRGQPPPGWHGRTGRVDGDLLRDVVDAHAHAFVCGPTPFVEAVAGSLVELGVDPARVKTERFGPTGR